MPRPRTFRKTKIALLGNLSNKDKIPNWIKHAGGQVSTAKDVEDDVTHLILSKEAWSDYGPIVKEARRKGTVYIMKVAWLIDSISINKNKLYDEVQSKYVWELDHARRVLSKNKHKQQEIRKANRIAKLDTKTEAWPDGMNNNTAPPADKQSTERANIPADKSTRTAKPVKPRRTSANSKQIVDTGVKLDKELLESERDMALKRYRPYVDGDGIPYLITLVRQDIAKKVKEQYDVKAIRPFSVTWSKHSQMDESFEPVKDIPRLAERFVVSDATIPQYFDDIPCHLRASDSRIEVIKRVAGLSSDGSFTVTSKVWPERHGQRPTQTILEAWEQHLPFSVYPVMTYDPDLTVKDAYRVTLQSRVYVPQPFAHSLQLYESFDYKEERRHSSSVLTPNTTNTSFTSYLSRSNWSTESTILASGEKLTDTSLPVEEKKYFLLHKYTRKSRGPPSIVTDVLVPIDSSWDAAHGEFCRFFKRKTGLFWEQAKRGSHAATDREDDVVGHIASPKSSSLVKAPLPEVMTDAPLHPTPALNATSSFGASFFNPSVPLSSQRSNPFRYVPNATEDLQEISNAYAERYRENWLPSHAEIRPSASQSNTSKATRTWAEVVAETKPHFSFCEDRSPTA